MTMRLFYRVIAGEAGGKQHGTLCIAEPGESVRQLLDRGLAVLDSWKTDGQPARFTYYRHDHCTALAEFRRPDGEKVVLHLWWADLDVGATPAGDIGRETVVIFTETSTDIEREFLATVPDWQAAQAFFGRWAADLVAEVIAAQRHGWAEVQATSEPVLLGTESLRLGYVRHTSGARYSNEQRTITVRGVTLEALVARGSFF